MKPSIKFLMKVERGEVCETVSYSARSGAKHGFRGGEQSYRKHRAAGYVNIAPGASLGRPGVVTLTDKGKATLAAAAADECAKLLADYDRARAFTAKHGGSNAAE